MMNVQSIDDQCFNDGFFGDLVLEEASGIALELFEFNISGDFVDDQLILKLRKRLDK